MLPQDFVLRTDEQMESEMRRGTGRLTAEVLL